MTRTVKVYPLQEMEIDALALFNSLATALFSLGSALVTYGLGIYSSATIQGSLTPRAWGFVDFAGPIPIAIGTLFIVGGILAWWRRYSLARKIKSEAEVIETI